MPFWQFPSGARLVELQEIVGTPSVIDFTDGIDDSSSFYQLIGNNIQVSNNDVELRAQVYFAGVLQTGSDYDSVVVARHASLALVDLSVGASALGRMSDTATNGKLGNAADEAANFIMNIHDPLNSGVFKNIWGHTTYIDANATPRITMAWWDFSHKGATTGIDGIRILLSAATFVAGGEIALIKYPKII